MICPVCKGTEIRGSHPQGYWEKEVFTLIFIRPFRCRSCRARFLRFSLRDESPFRKQKRNASTSPVVPPLQEGPPEQFEALIDEIRKAESVLIDGVERRQGRGGAETGSNAQSEPVDSDHVRPRKERH